MLMIPVLDFSLLVYLLLIDGLVLIARRDFALKKAREVYGMNNAPGYPKEQRWAGRPTARVSGVYDTWRERFGAQYGFHNGWEQPHWFAWPNGRGEAPPTPSASDTTARGASSTDTSRTSTSQHNAPVVDAAYRPSFRRCNWFSPVAHEVELVVNRVGLVDLTPFGKICVSGPRAAAFLDFACANALPQVIKLISCILLCTSNPFHRIIYRTVSQGTDCRG